VIFDNAKIKRLVPKFKAEIPFRQGAEEIAGWYANHPEFQTIEPAFDKLLDQIVLDMSRLG
jgi:hypothetical protein